MEYSRLEKQYKKQTGHSLTLPIVEEPNGLIAERILSLNKIQAQCVEKLEFIQKYEEFVCERKIHCRIKKTTC